jgi:tetratricopeptide (TPR) repeat protein
MSRPAGVPDPSPARLAEPTEPSPGRVRLGFEELTWVDVADIVWLAAAIRPASPEDERSGQDRPLPAREVTDTDTGTGTGTGTEVSGKRFPEPAPGPHTEPEKREPAESVAAEIAPEYPSRIRPGGEAIVPRKMSPDSLRLFRALRPLKRLVRSHRDDAVRLDEEATADWAVQTGMWWPITRPVQERWLDLTVVLDTGPSMTLWRSQVTAFLTALERLGAFRSIQVRLLETAGAGEPVLRGATAGTPEREPAEIQDHSGRRAVLLLTDAVGQAWRRGAVLPMLARWGRRMPVSVVHLLPQHLWRRCGMASGKGLHHARLGVSVPLQPNSRWALGLPDAWIEPDPSSLAGPGTVPVPVLEPHPRWLSWWARLITGTGGRRVTGTVLLTDDAPPATSPPALRLKAHEVVDRFRSLASPPALRLATLLAALPVDPDLVYLILREFVPEGSAAALCELLLGDLLYSPERQDDESTWDTRAFVFPEAVRQLLLNGARRSETASVVAVAAAHLGERIPVLGHLRDAIADPHNTPDPVPTPDNEADVALERAVMRALSGPYLSRADRLRNAVRTFTTESSESIPESSKTAREPATSPTTASDDMPEPAERLNESAISRYPAPDGHPVPRDEVVRATTHLDYAAEARTARERRPEDPPPVWGNVPPRNPNFTGREELLDQLSKRLTAGGTTAVLPAALHGMGGIGKTQIATEYIYRHLSDYDVIWWLEAARQTQIRAGLTELARQLGVGGTGDANSAVRAVREALRTGRPYRRWLLVFDAADSPDEVRSFFPTNGPGEVLITSRNPDWAGVSRPLELAVFKREESIELLRKRGPEIATADADRLAEKLGDLPLAIEQAAAWRAVTGMPVREYLRLFDESVSEILDTSAPPDYDVSVAAAWNVSFDELKTRNPAAHQMLHICAFLSPEPISRDLFTGVSRVSISPELDAALRDPIKLARAIRDINRYSLAKIDHGNNTIQLHRLVQLVLRNRVMAPQLQAQVRHGAHQLLASLDPNDPESSRHWPRYRELLPHAYAADVVACEDGWVRQLVINLMRYLFQWGDHEEAANLASRARAVFEDKLGPTHPQTLDVSQRLGLYLWGLGRYEEAARINQLTLQLRIQETDEESEDIFALQTNIVIDYRAQGDFAGATKLSEEIYVKSRRLFGEDDPETLNAAFQHALSLRLSGEYGAAAELDADTLRRRIEVLGPDHPKTLSTNAGLVIDRREAGEYTRARIEQEKLTELARTRLGEDNPDFVTYLYLLSVVRRKDGEHDRALSLSREAFERFTLIYGPDHPTTVACGLAHSLDIRHSGDLAKAKALGEEIFEGYRRPLGEDHPHTLAATVDLALTLRLRGETAEARALDERAVERLRAGIGPDHPYTIIATINLASDLAALGEIEAALELDRDAVERGSRVLGENHPTVLAAAFNLSLDLLAAGRAEEAQRYRDQTLNRYRKVLGEGHPATAVAAKGIRENCDIDPMGM